MKKRMYRLNPVRDAHKLIPLEPPKRDYGTSILTIIAAGILFGFLLWWAYGCGSGSGSSGPTTGTFVFNISELDMNGNPIGMPVVIGPYDSHVGAADWDGSTLYAYPKYGSACLGCSPIPCTAADNQMDCRDCSTSPVYGCKAGFSGSGGIPGDPYQLPVPEHLRNDWLFLIYGPSGTPVIHYFGDSDSCEQARVAAANSGQMVSGGFGNIGHKCIFEGATFE